MNNNNNKVKRYNFGLTITSDYSGFKSSEPLVYEDPNGDYVHINDYNKLESKWQPIETAPKTPSEVVIGVGEINTTIILCIAGKDYAEIGGYISSQQRFWTPDNGFANFTHWMPLPKPPTL